MHDSRNPNWQPTDELLATGLHGRPPLVDQQSARSSERRSADVLRGRVVAVATACLVVLFFFFVPWRQSSPQRSARAPLCALPGSPVPDGNAAPVLVRADNAGLGEHATDPGAQAPGESGTSIRTKSSANPSKPLAKLSYFTAPRRVAPVLPPVADRIILDPSLAETPSLPVAESTRVDVSIPEAARADGKSVDLFPAATSAGNLGRTPARWQPDVAASWPWPVRLVQQLEQLQQDPAAKEWAVAVLEHLHQLHQVDSFSDKRVGQQLEQLRQLREQAREMAARIQDVNQRARLLRAAYGLERRLVVWQPVFQLASPVAQQVALHHYAADDISLTIDAVKQHLHSLKHASQWSEYLLLDQLRTATNESELISAEQRSRLARTVLSRLNSPQLTARQEGFLKQEICRRLDGALREWVCEPVDYRALLDELERIETNAGSQSMARLAGAYQVLRWSPESKASELAEMLNVHYRNANIRVSVSEKLVNRLLPRSEPQDEPIDDVLLGARVYGHGRVSTRLRVVFVPDRFRWRVGLEARGQVDSKTATKHGPAKLFSSGRSHFLARKLLLIDHLGLRVRRAEADASTNANLTDMQTEFDDVPLLNVLTRAVVRQQYDQKSGAAQQQARARLAHRASRQLDEEVGQKLNEATTWFRGTVYQPLDELGLEPEAVDLQTTAERLTARYRLAGQDQLAAFTPRPQAPADSLLSVQVHESALNNTINALGIGGKTVEIRDLFREVATKLHRPDYEVPEDIPEDVKIRLTAEDPIQFRCLDNHIEVTIRIDYLSSGRRRWQHLRVYGSYCPEVRGLNTTFLRDGHISLKGRRLSFGDQVALRGIFSKVLPQRPEVDFLGDTLGKDPNLVDLLVNQFVIRDGWIGLAVKSTGVVHLRVTDRTSQPRR